MFERFTDRTRRVLVLAQEEACLLHHNFIGTEHLLPGLIHEGETLAARALASEGVTLEPAGKTVQDLVGNAPRAKRGGLRFSSEAKKAFEGALREALISCRRTDDSYPPNLSK